MHKNDWRPKKGNKSKAKDFKNFVIVFRQAVDAVAVVDKCSHLQKLLQDALDDKQKRQEEHNRQKTQLEMELAQLRLQMNSKVATIIYLETNVYQLYIL